MKKAKLDQPLTGTVTAEWLCSVTGLTDRWHRQLATKGYFPPPIRGRYQAAETLVGLIRYQREQIAKKNDTLRTEQELLTKAKREMAEAELLAFRDRYIEKEAIGPALRNVSLHQRAVLQHKFEQELAQNLAGLTPLETIARIKAAVDEVCNIFREGTKEWLEAPPKTTRRRKA
ncbi:MAG: hypothetical protein L0Y58_05690 [Verrucomicrobia subdivision 3 bacterium]|nr:hypothetical protein [Limisphaerales bacterium]